MEYTLSLLMSPLLWHWPKLKWRPVHTFFFNTNQTLITWGLFLVFLFLYKLKDIFLNNKKSVLRGIWQDTTGRVSTAFPEPCLLDLVFPLFQVTSFSPRPITVFPLEVPYTIFLHKIFFLILFWGNSWCGEGQRGYGSYIAGSENKEQREGGFECLKASWFLLSIVCLLPTAAQSGVSKNSSISVPSLFQNSVSCAHTECCNTQMTDSRVESSSRTFPPHPPDHSQANTKILQLA